MDVEDLRDPSGLGGGGSGSTVPGKYLGTNGAGPCMGGGRSWGASVDRGAPELSAAKGSIRRRVRRLLRIILVARHAETIAKTPTLPPIAPANVATFFF